MEPSVIDRTADVDAPPEGKRVAIFLVEDDGVVRRFISMILSKMGYSILNAEGACDALRLCADRRDPIDLVIMDVVLPESNGFLLSHELRRLHPEMRVLFMSGYTEEYLRSLERIPDQCDMIEKPFMTRTLMDRVRRALESP